VTGVTDDGVVEESDAEVDQIGGLGVCIDFFEQGVVVWLELRDLDFVIIATVQLSDLFNIVGGQET